MDSSHLFCLLCLGLTSSHSLDLPPVLDVTRLESEEPHCSGGLEAFRQGLDTGQLWAQTMLDASVKSPVGLLSQTNTQFGDFDECLTIDTPITSQYCLVNVSPINENQTTWTLLRWAVCVPATCSANELQISLQTYMDRETAHRSEIKVDVIPQLCTSKYNASRSITLADIIYCLVMASVLLVVCVATVYDVWGNPAYDGLSPPQSVGECLSARHGWYSLIRTDQPMAGVNLNVLYGLHVFSFFFVIMGHRFGVHIFFMQLTNYRSVEHMFYNSWFSMWACHMDLLVDIFFFMSAFLLSLFYYAALQKRYISPFMVYAYRLCRVVPVYAVVLFFYATLLRQLGDGPMWNVFMDGEQDNCRNYWWTNLLFINTYIEKNNMCLLQSWYISCEFQLFVCGTLLVLLIQRNSQAGVVVASFLFVASTLTSFLGTYLYNRPAIVIFDKDFMTDVRHHDLFTSIYSQGHYRGTSYLPGLLVGRYVYLNRKKPLSKACTYTMQTVGTVCCLLVYWSGALFYSHAEPPGRMISALYAALYHTCFGFGLALAIVSCALGENSPLTYLFSWTGFIPLGKLSFCVYLIQNIPQFVWVASSRTSIYMTPLELVSWTIGDVVISLLGSLVLYLTVETPAKYLFKNLTSGFAISSPTKVKKSEET